jgi:flagellin-specific chaperone FliS
MFKTNKTHRRKQLFGLENQLSEKMKKKLAQTIFPLFYDSTAKRVRQTKQKKDKENIVFVHKYGIIEPYKRNRR